ncbi:hypothetical protein [Actinomadura sp. B10D3]
MIRGIEGYGASSRIHHADLVAVGGPSPGQEMR